MAGCSALGGPGPWPWRRPSPSRPQPPRQASPARSCCSRSRSASWARQPRRHPRQPALQRRVRPRRAVPVPATAPGRRAPGPDPHHRDATRRDRRLGHPGGTGSRTPRLRPDGLRAPAAPGDLAGCHPGRPRPRPGEASAPHPGSRPDPAGVADRLRRRHLRDRRRLDLGSRLDRIRPPGRRSGPGRSRLDFRDLPRGGSPSPSCPSTRAWRPRTSRPASRLASAASSAAIWSHDVDDVIGTHST